MASTYRNSKFFHTTHLVALSGIAIGIPTSKVVISISILLALLNLLLAADFTSYWKHIKQSKLFWLITAFMLLHFIGLLWTEEIDFAFRDIRVKLPLIVIPFLLTSKPINKQEVSLILKLFVVATFITSIINCLFYFQLIIPKIYDDIRGLSLFGSHIRYGVVVAFSSIISLYFAFKSSIKWHYVLLFVWFTFYTYYSQVFSGALAWLIGVMMIIFIRFYQKNKTVAYVFLGSFLIIPLSIFIYQFNQKGEKRITKEDLGALQYATKQGNPYIHYFVDARDSKGNYLYVYYCETEIREAWNNISNIDFDKGLDLKKQELKNTLTRYMTSKGLRKDAEDFKKLSPLDIQNIERGIPEVDDGIFGIFSRIKDLKYQIQASNNPNGNSLLQRLEYWKTAMQIIQKNWFKGVGTGDTQKAFDEQYVENHSKLLPEYRFRAHNTYLTVWITFGVFALVFYLMLVQFFKTMIDNKNVLGLVFIIISILTFFIEDSLETQVGVTFFAFFWGIFSNQATGKNYSQASGPQD